MKYSAYVFPLNFMLNRGKLITVHLGQCPTVIGSICMLRFRLFLGQCRDRIISDHLLVPSKVSELVMLVLGIALYNPPSQL